MNTSTRGPRSPSPGPAWETHLGDVPPPGLDPRAQGCCPPRGPPPPAVLSGKKETEDGEQAYGCWGAGNTVRSTEAQASILGLKPRGWGKGLTSDLPGPGGQCPSLHSLTRPSPSSKGKWGGALRPGQGPLCPWLPTPALPEQSGSHATGQPPGPEGALHTHQSPDQLSQGHSSVSGWGGVGFLPRREGPEDVGSEQGLGCGGL